MINDEQVETEMSGDWFSLCDRQHRLFNGHTLTKYTEKDARSAVLLAIDLLIRGNTRPDVRMFLNFFSSLAYISTYLL